MKKSNGTSSSVGFEAEKDDQPLSSAGSGVAADDQASSSVRSKDQDKNPDENADTKEFQSSSSTSKRSEIKPYDATNDTSYINGEQILQTSNGTQPGDEDGGSPKRHIAGPSGNNGESVPYYINAEPSSQRKLAIPDPNFPTTTNDENDRVSGKNSKRPIDTTTTDPLATSSGIRNIVNPDIDVSQHTEDEPFIPPKQPTTIAKDAASDKFAPSSLGSKVLGLLAVITFVLSLIQIIVGGLNKNYCPMNPYIPLYLLVAGVLGIVLLVVLVIVVSFLLQKYEHFDVILDIYRDKNVRC